MADNKGFTLIELLVVISLMTFLASFVYVSFPRVYNKARAVTIVQDFQTINNAFRQLKTVESKKSWWRETDWIGSENPNVNDIEEISKFIPVEINPPIKGASYIYDNDGDDIADGPCGGVNIVVYNCGGNGKIYFEIIDDMVDGGDGRDAGRIRTDAAYSNICFNIAENEEY